MDNNISGTPQTPSQPPAYNLDEASEVTPQVSPVVTAPPPKRRGSRITAAFLLLAVLAGLGAYLLSRPEPGKAPTTIGRDIPLIRYGTDDKPLNTFYPNSGRVTSETEINNQIFEGLVKYEGLTQIVPALATGWSNPDSSTWLFNIRRNVSFHNGNRVTPADVKASIDYIIKNQKALDNQAVSTIKSVEITGQNQVKIVTDGPDPVLLNKLATLYIYDRRHPDAASPLDGTGPYTLKPGSKPTASSVDLVAYDKYYGGKVRTRALQFISYKQDDLITNFKNGKLDMIVQVAPETVKQLRNYPTFTSPNTLVYFLGFNTVKTGSPLQKLDVRKAINLALSRDELAKIINGEPSGQVIPPSIPGYNPEIAIPNQNVSKARQLLATAGYPNGFSLELTYSPIRKNVVDQIASQLAAVGIKVKLNELDDQFYDVALGGKTDMYYIGYSSDYLDGYDVLNSAINLEPNYNNPEFAKGLEAIASDFDAVDRVKALQKLSAQAANDAAVAPIATVKQVAILKKKYNFKVDTPNTLTDIYFYKATQR